LLLGPVFAMMIRLDSGFDSGARDVARAAKVAQA
jgi:hypothetical protein